MVRLHRHQLARLAPRAWARLMAQAGDELERDCLRHWAQAGLPLVVTQQRCGFSDAAAEIAMGLPAPLRWQRRRIALRVARGDVHFFDEFPPAARMVSQLPPRQRAAWARLCAALQAQGITARIYGSHGWQALTGLPYLRAASDIDLWMPVADAAQADAVAQALADADGPALRLDGELLFQGDLAVSWREWRRLRSGATRSLLIKSLGGSRLVADVDELAATVLEAA
jgi:phosphoribosyl-dephospho-CoA transferase